MRRSSGPCPQLEGVRAAELVVQVYERLRRLPQVGRDLLNHALRLVAGEASFVLVIPDPHLEHR